MVDLFNSDFFSFSLFLNHMMHYLYRLIPNNYFMSIFSTFVFYLVTIYGFSKIYPRNKISLDLYSFFCLFVYIRPHSSNLVNKTKTFNALSLVVCIFSFPFFQRMRLTLYLCTLFFLFLPCFSFKL